MRASFIAAFVAALGAGLAGCGRVGFDAVDPSADTIHDEDGDGVVDAFDVCPVVVDDQQDGDGDGVGDACDREVARPAQHRVVFLPMTAPDPRLSVDGEPALELGDAWELDGTGQPFTAVTVDQAIGDADVDVGFDVLGVGSLPRQLALLAAGAEPFYYATLYDSGAPVASLSKCSAPEVCGPVDQLAVPVFPLGPVIERLAASIGGPYRAQFDLAGTVIDRVAAATDATSQRVLQISLIQVQARIRYIEVIETR